MTPRYLHGYGLVELPLEDCAARLANADLLGRATLLPRPPCSRDEAVAFLGRLTYPATRWALFAVGGRWTAIVTNLRDGSDLADDVRSVSTLCRARACRVVDVEGAHADANGYRVRLEYPARIFELVEPDLVHGDAVRTIHCMLDGDRWSFDTWGDPLPVEASFDYDARLKRDRFTSDNLRSLLASIGVEVVVPDAFEAADRFHLLDVRIASRRWRKQVEARAYTAEQADDPGVAYLERGLDWVPYMDTHASSVVWDLTRAALLSPRLRPTVEPYLDAARRRLGDGEFERTASDAERSLREGRG